MAAQSNDVAIITEKDTRLKFINPNNVHGDINGIPMTPDYTDFCIYADLSVEIVNRLSTGVVGEDTSKVFHIIYTTSVGDDKPQSISFLAGEDYEKYKYLTTYYTDITANDVARENIVEGLGISSINIDYSNFYVPQISIQFIDVRGSSVFGREESTHTNSNKLTSENVFGCFFTLPYPKFRLQVKGFYGQAVTYQLACTSFKGRFDSNNGNFIIDTTFIGYQYSLLSDIPFTYLLIAPYCDYEGRSYWAKMITSDEWKLANGQQMKTLIEYYNEIKSAMYGKSVLGGNTSNGNVVTSSVRSYMISIKDLYNEAFKFDGNEYVTTYEEGVDEQTGKCSYLVRYSGETLFWTTQVEDKFSALEEQIKAFNNDYPSKKLEGFDFIGKYKPNDDNIKTQLIIDDSNNVTDSFKSKDSANEPITESLKSWINTYKNNFVDNKYGFIISDFGLLKKVNEILESAVIEEQDYKITRNILSFIPSLGNIVKVIMAHLETFTQMIYCCANIINNNTALRTPSVLKISLNATDVNSNAKAVPPFPGIYRKDAIGSAGTAENSEGWVGDISGNFEEEKLVIALMNAIQNTNSQPKVTITRRNAQYVPSIPLDFIFGNPFSERSNWSISSLAGGLAIRAAQLFGIANNSAVSEDIAKLHGEIDAFNFYKATQNIDEINNNILIRLNNNTNDILYKISLADTGLLSQYGTASPSQPNTYYYDFEYFENYAQDVYDGRHPIYSTISNDNDNLIYSYYCLDMGNKTTALIPSQVCGWNQIPGNGKMQGKKISLDTIQIDANKNFIYNDSTYVVYKNILDTEQNKNIYCDYLNSDSNYRNLKNNSIFKIIDDSEEISDIDEKISQLKTDTTYTDFAKDNISGNFNKVYSRYVQDDAFYYSKGAKLAKAVDESYTEKGYDTTQTQLETDFNGANDDFNRLVLEDYNEDNNNQYIPYLLYNNSSIEFSDIFQQYNSLDNKYLYIFFLLLHTRTTPILRSIDKGKIVNILTSNDASKIVKLPKQLLLLLGGYLYKILHHSSMLPDEQEYQHFRENEQQTFFREGSNNQLVFHLKSSSELYLTTQDVFGFDLQEILDYPITNTLIDYFLVYADRYKSLFENIDYIKNNDVTLNLPNNEDKYEVYSYFDCKKKISAGENVTIKRLNDYGVQINDILKKYQREYSYYRTKDRELFATYAEAEKNVNILKNKCIIDWRQILNADNGRNFQKFRCDTVVFQDYQTKKYTGHVKIWLYDNDNKIVDKELVYNEDWATMTITNFQQLRNQFLYFKNKTDIDHCNYIDAENSLYYYKSNGDWQDMLKDIFLSNVYVVNTVAKKHTLSRKYDSQKGDDDKIKEEHTYLYPQDANTESGTSLTIQISAYKVYLKAFLTKLTEIVTKYQNSQISENALMQASINNKYRDNCIPIYKYLKNLWDKWLLSSYKRENFNNPYSVKNFFKDFIFIDSFYRNTYNLLLSNVNILVHLIEDKNDKTPLFTVLSDFASHTNCLFLNIPDYIEFGMDNGEKSLKDIFKPIPFNKKRNMEVNNKFVFIYTHEPSKSISSGNGYNKDYITLMTDNGALTEEAKTCFAQSGKTQIQPNDNNKQDDKLTRYGYDVPAFAVKFTAQNNHLWKNVEVSMENPIATEISINVTANIAELGSNNANKVYFQGQDIYPIFSNYSFQCTVTMMGNAQIQPLMYFQLMNMPLWNGAYMIYKVNHSITPGNMVTTFTGMKMSKNCVPFVKEYVAREVVMGSGGEVYSIGGRINGLVFPSEYPDGDYQRYKDIYYNTNVHQNESILKDREQTNGKAVNTITKLRELYSYLYADILKIPYNDNKWNIVITDSIRVGDGTSFHTYGLALDLSIRNYTKDNRLTTVGNKKYLWYVVDLIMDKYFDNFDFAEIIFEYQDYDNDNNTINVLHIALNTPEDTTIYKISKDIKQNADKNLNSTNLEGVNNSTMQPTTTKTDRKKFCSISKNKQGKTYKIPPTDKDKHQEYLYIASKYYNKTHDFDQTKKIFPSIENLNESDLSNFMYETPSDTYYSQNVTDKAKAIFEIINPEEGGFNNTDGSSCSPTYRGLTMEFQLEYNNNKASFPNGQNFWEEFLKKYPFTPLSEYNEKRQNLSRGTNGYAMLNSDNPKIKNCVYGGNSQWERYQYLSNHIGDQCDDGSTLTQEEVERLEKLLNDERYTKYYRNIKLDELKDFVLSALICNFYYGEPGATKETIKKVANTDKNDYTTMYNALNGQCNQNRQQTINNMYEVMQKFYKKHYKEDTAAKKITRMGNIKRSAENYLKQNNK